MKITISIKLNYWSHVYDITDIIIFCAVEWEGCLYFISPSCTHFWSGDWRDVYLLWSFNWILAWGKEQHLHTLFWTILDSSLWFLFQDVKLLVEDIGELKPTIFCAVPRVLDRIFTGEEKPALPFIYFILVFFQLVGDAIVSDDVSFILLFWELFYLFLRSAR